MIAGARLRAGKTNSGKGAARMIAQAVATARAAGVRGQILVRGDSAYGNSTVVAACRRAGARFSLVLTKNRTVAAAIDAIDEDAWTPVKYPGAVRDPDTGAWISDAEVAEIGFTAFASTPHAVTARLIVRRVKDARYRDALFPVWRYHPFFTNTDEATGQPRAAHYGGPESLCLLHAWISFDSLLSAMSGLPQLAVGVKSASHRLIGNLGRVHLAGSRKRRHGNRLGPSELPDEAAPE